MSSILNDTTVTSPDQDNQTLSFDYTNERRQSLGCHECRQLFLSLYQDNKLLLQSIQLRKDKQNEMGVLYDVTATGLAVRRLPALLVTLCLELMGGIIIHQLDKVIQGLTLIVSFMPAISALSGNLGLQASANTVRGLGTGHILPSSYCKNITKEIRSGFLSATLVAVLMSSVGIMWAHFDSSMPSSSSSSSQDIATSTARGLSMSTEVTTSLIMASTTSSPSLITELSQVNVSESLPVFHQTLSKNTSTTTPSTPLGLSTTSTTLSTPSTNLSSLPVNLSTSPAVGRVKRGVGSVTNPQEATIADRQAADKPVVVAEVNPVADEPTPRGPNPYLFGLVIFIGTFISMMVSTVNGASTPIMATMAGLDPAKVAGPLETAFQDIVGQSFLLGLSYLIFHHVDKII